MFKICNDLMSVAASAPPALCPTPESREALRQFLMFWFATIYERKPDLTAMREDGGCCVLKVRPSDLLDDGREHTAYIVPPASAEFAWVERLAKTLDIGDPVSGESFTVALVFCDEVGETLKATTTLFPAGRHYHWPPPLTFMLPILDTVCNVIYHVVDRAPLEAFGGDPAAPTAFREAMFAKVIPIVYSDENAAHRQAGRAFMVNVMDGTFTISVVDGPADASLRDDEPWVYGSTEAGVDFPLVLNFMHIRSTHLGMPCVRWPVEVVAAWLQERPGSDACRECGVTGVNPRKRCSSCRVVWYCSEACQLADWRRHKCECVMLRMASEAG